MVYLKPLVLIGLFNLAALSQDLVRDQKVQKIHDLRSQIAILEKDMLQPDAKDVAAARAVGAEAVRLLPREKYDRVLAIRGGGAYYSFVRKAHEYGLGSDIELQQGELSVGFAGADYGFLIDLGQVDLADINEDLPSLDFLLKYSPPTEEPAIRAEQSKSRKYEANGFLYQRSLPAIVGHSYALRSIGMSDSDILVAINVLRKDGDGSLIILWKPLEKFAKPTMRRPGEAAVR